MQETLRIQDVGCGEVKLTHQVHGDTSAAEMVAKWVRSLPKAEQTFFKDCRIAAVIPLYLPKGDFDEKIHALRMDPDQLEWFLRQHPEFTTNDDTANNHLSTGGKIIVS